MAELVDVMTAERILDALGIPHLHIHKEVVAEQVALAREIERKAVKEEERLGMSKCGHRAGLQVVKDVLGYATDGDQMRYRMMVWTVNAVDDLIAGRMVEVPSRQTGYREP